MSDTHTARARRCGAIPSLRVAGGPGTPLADDPRLGAGAPATRLVNGCGVGMYLRALQESVPEVHGMDIEGEHLRAAVANVPGAPLNLSRASNSPTPMAASI